MGRVKDTESFIEKCEEVHGNKYDYSKAHYVNARTKVTIICSEHGEFQQTPPKHLEGKNCPMCAEVSRRDKMRKTVENFVEDSVSVHGDKYHYDKTVYKNNNQKVTITCPEHGDFEMTPLNHLKGKGCRECYLDRRKQKEQTL